MAVLLTRVAIRKGIKTCRVCKKTKPISEFVLNLDNKWMPNDCRDCEKKRQRGRYKLRGYHNKTYREELTNPRPMVCEVCVREAKICYDHCHLTGLFRGWLCKSCNDILGWAEDDPDRLKKLALYLESFYRSEAIRRLLPKDDEEDTIYLPI